MSVSRSLRSFVAVGAVVAFNLLMSALAATAGGPIGPTLLVAWIAGDSAVCLVALALTERS